MKFEPQPYLFFIWENYAAELGVEYQQSLDEGLDIEQYKDLFEAVKKLPNDENKVNFANSIFELISNAKTREGYKYNEPSSLEEIKKLRNLSLLKKPSKNNVPLKKKIEGAWFGRICGCLLGKTVEGAWTETILDIAKSSDNFPIHRYFLSTDLKDEVLKKTGALWIKNNVTADKITMAPFDDDTNYTVMAQCMVDYHGMDFKPRDVLETWVRYQGREAYCTAERVAYKNYISGFVPPQTAMYKNPYREWIGAQIRGDYYGYITSDPEKAAELAFNDASISHIKNGIYGEMFVSAMLAYAHKSDNIIDVINAGLSQIPSTSRLYEEVSGAIDDFNNGMTEEESFEKFNKKYNYKFSHDWCHTISNAIIVTLSLLYGNGNYGKSICRAVQTGFDTDCNGATVGSILGMMYGIDNIGEEWTGVVHNTLRTQIFGHEKVKVSDLVKKTIEHIKKFK